MEKPRPSIKRRMAACAIYLMLIAILLVFWPGLAAAQIDDAVNVPSFAPASPVRFERFSLEDGLSQNSVLAMLQDRQGFLWFGTQEGLNRYDGYTFTTFKHDPDDPNSLSMNSILALYEDREGILWNGTWRRRVQRTRCEHLPCGNCHS